MNSVLRSLQAQRSRYEFWNSSIVYRQRQRDWGGILNGNAVSTSLMYLSDCASPASWSHFSPWLSARRKPWSLDASSPRCRVFLLEHDEVISSLFSDGPSLPVHGLPCTRRTRFTLTHPILYEILRLPSSWLFSRTFSFHPPRPCHISATLQRLLLNPIVRSSSIPIPKTLCSPCREPVVAWHPRAQA